MLRGALAELGEAAQGVEVLNPQYASLVSSPPTLLSTSDAGRELSCALQLAREDSDGTSQGRACIVVCGAAFSQLGDLAGQLGIPLLDGTVELRDAPVVLSDLEQVKGFEFDRVIIVNCRNGVMPHPLRRARKPSETSAECTWR